MTYDGIDVNLRNTEDTGKTPLIYAAASELPELIQPLVDAGA